MNKGFNEMTEVMMIPVSSLEPHPDALRFWTFDHNAEKKAEDELAILASVESEGIKQPLHVIPSGDGKTYLVLDGCSRLAGAKNCGIQVAPCIVRDVAPADLERNMFILNMDRKRFTTGQRIMKYLLDNKFPILEARETNMDPKKSGRKGIGGGVVQNAPPLSATRISGHLGVEKRDVLSGIELLACHEEGKIVVIDKANGTRELHKLINEEDLLLLEAVYQSVLDGNTHIRTWLPAFYGKQVDPETSGKQHINYRKHAGRTFSQLTTIFKEWDSIEKTVQVDIEKVFRDVVKDMPDDLLREVEYIISERRENEPKAKKR